MKRVVMTVGLLLVLVSSAWAALCSDGQQLYSTWCQAINSKYDWEYQVAVRQKSYDTAAADRDQKQEDISNHMASHGCNDPQQCSTLSGLLDELDGMIQAVYVAWDYLQVAQTNYGIASDLVTTSGQAYFNHINTCPNCD